MNILDSMYRIPKSEVERYLYVQYTLQGRDEEFKLYVEDEETETVAFPRSAARFQEYDDRTTSGRLLNRYGRRKFVARPHQEELIEQTLEGLSLYSGGVLVAPPGVGKALANFEPILTEDGWIPIGDAEVGMKVFSEDGKPYSITGVFPQGFRECFEVEFTDGTPVVCDADHIWTLQKRRDDRKPFVDITMGDLAKKPLRDGSGRLYFLPMTDPVDYGLRPDLRIDPYTLGALLGDGGLSTPGIVTFTTMDQEVFEYMVLPPNHRPKPMKYQNAGKALTYMISRNRDFSGKTGALFRILESYGLMGTDSHSKFIPFDYLWAPVEDRLALLQGLFDTDGSAVGGRTVDFSTASEDVAEGVKSIVHSLGGTCAVRARWTPCGGKRFLSFRLQVKLPSQFSCFRLSRKREVHNVPRQREPYRAVESIKKVGKLDCTCISVDCPSRLFLTREYIPTHNTIMGTEIAMRIGRSTCILVHKDFLAEQWEAAIRALSSFHNVGRVKQDRCDTGKNFDFVIASTQSITAPKRKYPREFYESFGLLICDECFIGSQEILTPEGSKPIRDIKFGDRVFNAIGQGTVEKTFSKVVLCKDLRVVQWKGGETICTASHPFLTTRGWVSAKDLCTSDLLLTHSGCTDMMHYYGKTHMPMVQERELGSSWKDVLFPRVFRSSEQTPKESMRGVRRSSCERSWPSILFEQVYAEISLEDSSDFRMEEGSFRQVEEVASRQSEDCKRGICSYDSEESDASGDHKEGRIRCPQKVRPSAKGSRGERASNASTSVDAMGIIRAGMDSRVRGSNPFNEKSEIPSDLLQNRYCQSLQENSDRGGWKLSQHAESTDKRFKERHSFEVCRVESVSIPKREDFSRFGISGIRDTRIRVYNLGVSGHPSYVLSSGIVVHNCHRYSGSVWHQSLMKFPARYRLGLTATADRYDGLWGIVSEHVGPIVAKLDIPAIPNKVYMVKLLTGIEDRQWKARWMNDNMQRAKLISILATHEGRNAVIIRNLLKAIAKQRRIMVISERLVQIDLLKDALLKEGVPKDSMGFFVGGKKKSQLADASEKPIIFSTYQMAKEGLDIEALDTLFLGTPQYDIRQTVGRILRELKGKSTPVTVDFVDADIQRLKGQAMGRIKMYKSMGCEIEGRI